MLVTQRMMTEKSTTVIIRIRMVPTTSDTPDTSLRSLALALMAPPPSREKTGAEPSRRYIIGSG